MNKVQYHVLDENIYICFNDRLSAFRYAERVGSKEIFMEVSDQLDWYYWDWDTERWVYP